jgi:hypothetical protein
MLEHITQDQPMPFHVVGRVKILLVDDDLRDLEYHFNILSRGGVRGCCLSLTRTGYPAGTTGHLWLSDNEPTRA